MHLLTISLLCDPSTCFNGLLYHCCSNPTFLDWESSIRKFHIPSRWRTERLSELLGYNIPGNFPLELVTDVNPRNSWISQAINLNFSVASILMTGITTFIYSNVYRTSVLCMDYTFNLIIIQQHVIRRLITVLYYSFSECVCSIFVDLSLMFYSSLNFVHENRKHLSSVNMYDK